MIRVLVLCLAFTGTANFSGCAATQGALGRAATPYSQIDVDPNIPGIQPPLNSSKTPAGDVASGLTLFSNPFNPVAWLELVTGLAVILGGGKVVRKVGGVVGAVTVNKAKKVLNGGP